MLDVDFVISVIREEGQTPNSVIKALGWGNGAIERWRTSSPGVDKIFALSNFLSVPVSRLLKLEPEVSEEARKIAERYERLSPDGRACVLAEIVHAEERDEEKADKKEKALASSDAKAI